MGPGTWGISSLACSRLWLLVDVFGRPRRADGGRGGISAVTLTCPSDTVDGWTDRWTESKHKSDFGKFVLSAGKFYGDQDKDKGKSLELSAEIQEDFLEETLVTDGQGIRRNRAGRGRGMAGCIFDS